MRIYLEPIDVTHAKGLPERIRWRQYIYTVLDVIDYWVYESEWWMGRERDDRRVYFLVVAARSTPRVSSNSVLEVFRSAHAWTLSRVLD